MRILCFFILLAGSIASGLEFNYGDWELTLHDKNGSWDKLYWKGNLICDNPEQRNLLWLKRENMQGEVLFQNAVMDEKGGILTILTRQGKWNFTEKITFGKDLRRQFFVTWTGDSPVRLWEHNTAFPMPKKGTFFLPCSMFGDQRTYYEEITQTPNHVDVSRGEMANLKSGNTLKGSMDQAGFVYFQPTPDYTVTLIADAASLVSRAFLKGAAREVICEFYASSCGWAQPGKPQSFPEFRLIVTPGIIADAMKTVPHRYYRELGMVPPKDRENWLLDASIYELDLETNGGAIKAAEKRLPYIRKRGFNTLWVQPVEYLGPYSPEDYFRIRQSIGTENDYRHFIAQAHALGFRVLQDVVPHGSFPRFAETRGVSPFTLSIDENGQCYANESFDYSSPEWRNYFYQVIRHWMNVGVDGFRVDQCGVSPANWRLPNFPRQAPKALRKQYWDAAVAQNGGTLPPIEGARADDSRRLGPMKLTDGIRRTARSCKADAAILGEGGNYMQPYCDVVVDMPIRHAILKMLFFSPEEYTQRYLDTMEEKYWMDPPDIRRVSLFEIHDNDFRASQIVGEAPAQALRCTWFWNRSIPMVMDARESGQGVLLTRLNLLREKLEELRRGDIDFKAVKSKPLLFAPIRFMPEKSSICVTSFYPEQIEAELLVPLEKLGFPAGSHIDLFDSFQGKKIASGKLEQFRKIKYLLPPYGSAVLTFRRHGSSCPMPPMIPNETVHAKNVPLSVSVTAETIEVHGVYPLSINKKNGMILRYGKLIGKSDILSDAEIPSIRPDIKVDQSENAIRIEAVFGNIFSLIYTAKVDQLEVKGVLNQYDRKSRYAFLLNASSAKRWQLFGVDGLRDDFVDSGLIDLDALGSLNGMHKEHLGSPILHRTFSMPLNPSFPVIRLWNTRKDGMEIVQNDPFDPAYDEVMLLNRIKNTAGIHVAFFWNQPAPLSTGSNTPRSFVFTVRPASERNPVEAAANVNGVDFRFSGIDWSVDNGRFNGRFGKNGGVLKSVVFNGKKHPSVSAQDIVAKGFTNVFHTPGRASFDMETQCRILRTPGGVELRFLSWLRNFANAGVIQPPVWNYMIYQLKPNAEKIESDWGVYVTQFPRNAKATLAWSALSQGKELLIPVSQEHGNIPARRWIGFSADFTAEGICPSASRRKWANRSYLPMMEWNIRSFSDQKSYLARLTSDMPENWKFKYIGDYRIIPFDNTISYQFDLPVMWPHTVTPVDLLAGRYRVSTMLRTTGVKKSGVPGSLRFKLAYIDASGRKQLIDRGYVIPDGDNDWHKVSEVFEVPAGASNGELTILAYKVFGKGTVQFKEPVWERIEE